MDVAKITTKDRRQLGALRDRITKTEEALQEQRAAFAAALAELHERTGASYTMIGRAVHLSKQRVGELIHHARK